MREACRHGERVRARASFSVVERQHRNIGSYGVASRGDAVIVWRAGRKARSWAGSRRDARLQHPLHPGVGHRRRKCEAKDEQEGTARCQRVAHAAH